MDMETTTFHNTTAVHDGWALARRTALGIILMATLGGLAGFACARLFWM